MRTVDRVFGWLLILGGIGHTAGSLQGYRADPMMLLWALSASVLVWLLGAINLLRAGRSGDRALGWICLAGNLVWLLFDVRFGVLIGNVLDVRPLLFAVVVLVLSAFCVRMLMQGAQDRGRPL